MDKYSRDISGKELAIYKDNSVLEYPVYGLDMIGKIKNDERYFYMKDHLGSVRATVNTSGDIVSSQDYACPPWRDAWGYLLQDRIYVSDTSTFKYTGKERDIESEYDYFGARYYDSRIGRWGEVDPQLSNSPSLTPYNYTSDNPIARIDPSGLDDYYFMSNKTVRTKTDNADRFLVEHSKGNIMGIGSDLVKGYNFFEANSFETVTLHDWNKIDINFKSGKFVEAFNDAIPGILEAFAIKSKYLSAEFYIIYESTGARKMDQKEHVLDIANTLFLFNNILYNKNEAANIVWGAVNAYLGVDPAELAMFYANIASMIQNKRPDEPWDQLSIKRGWYYYDSDFKNFKKK